MTRLGRLRTAAEFKRVYTTGRTYHGPEFVLRVASSENPANSAAFGFVVSTKISKSAVVRNRIRRRAREFARRNAAEIPTGQAVAVIAKAGAATLSPSETTKALSSVFKQATLIR